MELLSNRKELTIDTQEAWVKFNILEYRKKTPPQGVYTL